MTFGDGVNFRLLPAGAKLPVKYQLRIEFSDHTSLVCSVQMYGRDACVFGRESRRIPTTKLPGKSLPPTRRRLTALILAACFQS